MLKATNFFYLWILEFLLLVLLLLLLLMLLLLVLLLLEGDCVVTWGSLCLCCYISTNRAGILEQVSKLSLFFSLLFSFFFPFFFKCTNARSYGGWRLLKLPSKKIKIKICHRHFVAWRWAPSLAQLAAMRVVALSQAFATASYNVAISTGSCE